MDKNIFKPNFPSIIQALYARAFWEIPGIVGVVIAALLSRFDPLEFIKNMNPVFAIFLYSLMGLGGALLLYWAWKLARYARQLSKPVVAWKLTPRDFGLDSEGARRVGFEIEEPQGAFDVTLEMFWLSGRKNPDEMQFRYALNPTSRLLKRTPDGQIMLAIAWKYAYPYSLVLDDGYYGLFRLDGYYKARISVRDAKKHEKTCFDVLILYEGHDSISVVGLNKVDCNDPLKHIPPDERVDDTESKNWSTVPNFQPNVMYRGQ